MPSWLASIFQKHANQISPSMLRSSRHMINWNKKGARRAQNMDLHNVGTFAAELASRLKKPCTKNYIAKSFRRSGATQLVEAGILIAGGKLEVNNNSSRTH